MFDLIAILIPIVLAICVVVVIRIIEDGRLRRHIVDAGADEALARTLLSDLGGSRRGSLKWGVVLLLIAGGFAAMWTLGLDADNPLSYALLFAASGLGLLVFRWLDAPAG
jgi:hypothetical protein